MASCIAIVVDPWDFPFNGTVVSTRRFVEALDGQYQFKILGTSETEEPLDSRMISFDKVSIPGFNSILETMKVPLARPDRARIRKALEDADLLHLHFPFFLGYAAISEARKLGIPVVSSFHVQPENLLLNVGIRSRLLAKWVYWFFMVAFYNRSDLVIAPSEFAAQELLAHGLTKPVEVISNGVPGRFFEIQRDVITEKKTEGGLYKILSVGRLAKEKQQALLLRAIARSRFKESVELNIVGTGPRENELRRLARTLNINARIEAVSDEVLSKLYSEADLFVHTGEIELEGMSVMEAIASANTVLVSDSKDSAIARLVTDERARFINDNVVNLSEKIDYLLEHPEERQALATANREGVKNLSHSKSVVQLTSVYEALLADAKASVGITQIE